MLLKNIGSLDSQGAIHIDIKIRVFRKHILLFDSSEEIQHLLSSAHSKGRHHHVSVLVKGSFQNFHQFPGVVRPFAVTPVPIGGFHDHVIRAVQIFRILYKRLVQVADVSGEHDFLLHALLCYPNLNT